MATDWPHLEEPSQRQPMTRPKYLGRGICLSPPTSPHPVDTFLLHSFLAHPPLIPLDSLPESLMEPEAGYEAPVSSSPGTE